MVMQKVLIFLVAIAALSTVSHSQSESAFENCTFDYETLERALMSARHNIFLLKTTFFPPHTASPLYLTVTYNFPTGASVDYIWSSADLYLTIHPHIISYLSLFFSFIETDRVVHMELQLPEECSDLTNNTRSDPTNFLFVFTHRLWYYTQDSTTDLKDLEAVVVAAENRNHHHGKESVALFFSLVIGLPIAVFVLVWVTVRGAFPYIRCHINDSDIFPSIAALHWIGQTFTVFVIVMDIIALSQNSVVNEYDTLQSSQFIFVSLVVSVEILGLLLSSIFALIPLFSHSKNTTCKNMFERYYTLICCGVMPFKKIGRKEARVWLFLSSLLTPIIAISSHAGFIIGSWVSYEDRSIAIFLLYLFVFVFLYWSLQYMYKFSTAVVNNTIRKEGFITTNHHEKDMTANKKTIKHIGFDTLALFLMIIPSLFVYGIVFYLGLGLAIPLLSSIDKALVHIFSLGKYAVVISVFLLTYKLFTISNSGGSHRVISNDALKYWKFLNREHQQQTHVPTLHSAMERLLLTLKAIKTKERKKYTAILKQKKFDLEVVADYLQKAKRILQDKKSQSSSPGTTEQRPRGFLFCCGLEELASTAHLPNTPTEISSLLDAVQELENITARESVDLEGFETQIQRIQDFIEALDDDKELPSKEQEAAKEFCRGMNHFQRTLVKVIGVPPMYMNSDKASALTAALVYQKVNSLYMKPGEQRGEGREESRPEGNDRYSLLLSLIEEEF